MQALRFLTAGSVDDGKSTLIGRLLLDSQAILADQMDVLAQRASSQGHGQAIDLSLLTDGLEAEREQGITIDVAYRYFATRQRKFIIADAPGHEQYTRNMVTAAAGSDAAVVLVDITKIDWRAKPLALLPQTRRHSLLAHLLRVPSIVFAVNKIDAIADAEEAFNAVKAALLAFAEAAGFQAAGVVPVSALRGDNVTQVAAGGWYQGPSLLGLLHTLPSTQEDDHADLALPVQFVARLQAEHATQHPQAEHATQQPPTVSANLERVFWGRIARGTVRAGDHVTVQPAGHSATVLAVRRAGKLVAEATAGESAGLVLDRPVDVSRGDWLIATKHNATTDVTTPANHDGLGQPSSHFTATLAWLDTEPAQVGRKLWVRHAHAWVQARITSIDHRLDIATLQAQDAHTLGVNDIGQVTVQLQSPVPLLPYRSNRTAGSMIVVDPATHRTSGALLVLDPTASLAQAA
jgi:sulfate adenylyltransferase subunit 1